MRIYLEYASSLCVLRKYEQIRTTSHPVNTKILFQFLPLLSNISEYSHGFGSKLLPVQRWTIITKIITNKFDEPKANNRTMKK